MTYEISIFDDNDHQKIALWWKNYIIQLISGYSHSPPYRKLVDKDLLKYHAKLEVGGIIVFDTIEDYVMFILEWC